jgi:FKBP-type peptidyl-prolyl cis-trans isomerase FkpA
MKRLLASTFVAAFAVAPLLAEDAPAPAASSPASADSAAPATTAKSVKKVGAVASGDAFKSDDERAAYAYGYKIGQNVSQIGMSDAEVKVFNKGIYDAASNKPAKLDMAVYLPKVSDFAQKRAMVRVNAEKKKGQAFADKFAKDDSVKAIPNGGFIKIVTAGTGAQPGADDTVKVHYRGALIDGTEFDSSYKRGQPTSFPLKGVIPCWTNGVAMMTVGSKAKLVCPSDVAYGDQGQPRAGIAGGSTLVFDVELLEIAKPDAPKDDAPKSDEKPAKPAKK